MKNIGIFTQTYFLTTEQQLQLIFNFEETFSPCGGGEGSLFKRVLYLQHPTRLWNRNKTKADLEQ